ncbi:MAG TPA: hypothetical protein PLD55_14465 [bacterium]|nr:hypothetical protein [bacterium]
MAKSQENIYNTPLFIKDLVAGIKKGYDNFMNSLGTISPENIIACENAYSDYCGEISKETIRKDLFKRSSTEESAIVLATEYLKRSLKKALKESNNKTRSKLARHLKDVLKKNADEKQDFKYYDVHQSTMLDNSARVYGNIKWNDYKTAGIYQGLWVQHIDKINEFEQYEVREVSEKKQPYSNEQLIDGTKRLHIICGQYLSPEHIMKGLEHWMDLDEPIVRIDDVAVFNWKDKKSMSSEDHYCFEVSTSVEKFFPEFIEILLSFKGKEFSCFLTVSELILKDQDEGKFTKVKKILGLKSSQDVKNNFEKACEKVKEFVKDQEKILIFQRTLQDYFENGKFRSLVDIEVGKRRTK